MGSWNVFNPAHIRKLEIKGFPMVPSICLGHFSKLVLNWSTYCVISMNFSIQTGKITDQANLTLLLLSIIVFARGCNCMSSNKVCVLQLGLERLPLLSRSSFLSLVHLPEQNHKLRARKDKKWSVAVDHLSWRGSSGLLNKLGKAQPWVLGRPLGDGSCDSKCIILLLRWWCWWWKVSLNWFFLHSVPLGDRKSLYRQFGNSFLASFNIQCSSILLFQF